MLQYTLRRILIMIPTLLVISFVTFAIIKLPPGDFLSNQIAELQSQGDKAALEKVDFLRKQYGLDKPFLEQYAVWAGLWPSAEGFHGLLQGDLGWSFEYDLPVKEVVGDRLLLSFVLNFSVILFTWAVSFPIGVYAATRQYSWGDHGLTLLGYVGLATPNFLLALVLMYFANVKFGLSVGGIMAPEYLGEAWSWAKARSVLEHLWIPVIVIGTSGTAGMIRRLRANLLDELQKQYVVTARAKGMPPFGLFISEVLIVTAAYQRHPWIAAVFLGLLALAFAALLAQVLPMILGESLGAGQHVAGSTRRFTVLALIVNIVALSALGLYMPGFLRELLIPVVALFGTVR